MIGRKTTVHGNGTKWLLLGGCSCFFLCFCREQKVISRRGAICEGEEEESESLFTRTMKGEQPVVQETAAKWQITRVYPQPPFLRGRAFHLGNQAALSDGDPRNFSSVYPSYKPTATMLTTSFRHVVEDLSQSLGSLCRLRPKSLWSIHRSLTPPPSLRRQSFSDEKSYCLNLCPGTDDIFYACE